MIAGLSLDHRFSVIYDQVQ